MATPSDILTVRTNTDEPTEVNYTDVQLSDLIDALGVAGASAQVWEWKAARFSSMVDVTEAGASHKNSDLAKNALAMAKQYQSQTALVVETSGRPIVRQIER